jgi:hypothetical protein
MTEKSETNSSFGLLFKVNDDRHKLKKLLWPYISNDDRHTYFKWWQTQSEKDLDGRKILILKSPVNLVENYHFKALIKTFTERFNF